jgi:hypothetical protein
MPKSHKRGGAKAHRKRVALRNEKIKSDWKLASKDAWETFEKMKAEKQLDENKNNEGLSGLVGFNQEG